MVGLNGRGLQAQKKARKQRWRRETIDKNAIASDYCGGAIAGAGLGSIACHEAVTIGLNQWLEEGHRLPGGEPKWQRH